MLVNIIVRPATVAHAVPYLLLFCSLPAQKWGLFWGIVSGLLRHSRLDKSRFCLYPDFIAINLAVRTEDEAIGRSFLEKCPKIDVNRVEKIVR